MDDSSVHAALLTPPRPGALALLLAVLIGGGFYLGGKYIETRDHTPTTISVSGEGKVTGAPDIAQLTFGVTTGRQGTAKGAMQMLTQEMNKVIAAVKAAGVAEQDITTSSFSLQPQYDWVDGKQLSRGFEASETLTVKVRDLDKTSDVLGAATTAGANQAGDVNFTIDNPETLRAQAREKAIAQAKEKAIKLAQELGMQLGTLKGFNEGSSPVPPMPYVRTMGMAASGAADMAVPLPAGDQDIMSSVSLTYELK
jgi:uncharacterized protein YggE